MRGKEERKGCAMDKQEWKKRRKFWEGRCEEKGNEIGTEREMQEIRNRKEL